MPTGRGEPLTVAGVIFYGADIVLMSYAEFLALRPLYPKHARELQVRKVVTYTL